MYAPWYAFFSITFTSRGNAVGSMTWKEQPVSMACIKVKSMFCNEISLFLYNTAAWTRYWESLFEETCC